MNGFVIAIVVIIFVISTVVSKKRKDAGKSAAEQKVPQPAPPAAAPVRTPVQARMVQHVVEPSFTTGHAHCETSMTGVLPCEPVRPVRDDSNVPVLKTGLDVDDAMRGVVFAEIIGKPVSLRKR